MGASSSSIKSGLGELSDALATAVAVDDVITVSAYLDKMRSRTLNAFFRKVGRSKYAVTPAEIAFSRNNVDILMLFITYALQEVGAENLFQLVRWIDRFPRVQDATVIAILSEGVDLDARVHPIRLCVILCVYGMHAALKRFLTRDSLLNFPEEFMEEVVSMSILRQRAHLKDLDRCVFDALPYLDHGEPLHYGDWTHDHTECLRLLQTHGLDLERPCTRFTLREGVYNDGVRVGESERVLVLTPLQRVIVGAFCPPNSHSLAPGYCDESMLKLQLALVSLGVKLRDSDIALYESFMAQIDDTHLHVRRRHAEHLASLNSLAEVSSS